MIDEINDERNNKSVTCLNIPEIFLDKNIATKYFNQFGPIHSFISHPKRLTCTVIFETVDSAKKALASDCVYDGMPFNIMHTPKEKLKSNFVDPDVQSELNAMSGFASIHHSDSTFKSNQVSRETAFREPIFRKLEMKMNHPIPMEPVKKNILRPATKVQADPPQPQPTTSQKPVALMDVVTRNELETILRKSALTAEEKYRVLDARDKLIRLTKSISKDIKEAISTKGVCPDMCPEKERLMREAKHQIALFELELNSKNTINHKCAIKQYSRSSADQESPLPHELRPEPVLKLTMNYLLHEIVDLCDGPDVNISDWYHFVWDRTRGIRKDITQQELCSVGVVSLIEQCARWHIHCAARLIAEEPQVFDQKINTENLTKCLQSLKYMYHDLRLKNERCPNEAEFRAYVVLLNLHDSNFLWELNRLPAEIRQSPELKFALEIYLTLENQNYVKFFQMVRRTTYLNACILLRYFTQVRVKALQIILKSYILRGPVPMTISYWTYILAFEDSEQCAQFFEYYGQQCDRNDDRVLLDRSSFFHPDLPFYMERAINIVEHKRITTIGEAVLGAPLDGLDQIRNYVPQNSFDENGYLYDEAWLAEDQNYFKPITHKQKTSPMKAPDREDNVFKVPFAPVKSQQSSKPSIFTKLSPKQDNEPTKKPPPPPPTFGESAQKSSISTSEFSTKSSTEFPSTTSTQNIFSLSNFASTNQPKNIFQMKSTDDQTTSKNIFQMASNPSWNTQNSANNQSNIFKLASESFPTAGAPTQSVPTGNIFQMTSKPSLATSTFQSASSSNTNDTKLKSIFQISSFSNNNINHSSETKSTFGGPSTTNKNIFQFPAPTLIRPPITNATPFSIDNLKAGTVELIDEDSNEVLSTESLGKINNFSNGLRGIVPLYPLTDSADDAKKQAQLELEQKQKNEREVEEQKRKEAEQRLAEEEEKKRQLIEAEAKKKVELEKQKKLELEKQKQIELKRKKKEMVEMASTLQTQQILDETISEQLKQIAKDVLMKYQLICESSEMELEKLLHETIDEELITLAKDTLQEIVRLQRQRNLENMPIWVPDTSIHERVSELQHPQQHSNLSLRKRYQTGHAESIRLPSCHDETIDPFKVIPPEIPEPKSHKTQIFWKCALSVPDTNEDPLFSRIDKWLNTVFHRRCAKDSTLFFCEQFRNPLARCSFSICLRKFIGAGLLNESGKTSKSDMIGLNGVIFLVSTANLKAAKQRLESIIKHSGINDALSIVIYNSGKIDPNTIRQELNLDQLIGRHSDYDYDSYFICCDPQKSISDLLEQSLKFVASQFRIKSLLEMQSTTSILSECLADQFWNRINASAQRNPSLAKSLSNVNFLIKLYNDAINKMLIIFTKDNSHHPNFPHELRRFLPKLMLNIPSTYEYFPIDWKSPKRIECIRKFLLSLKLNTEFQLDVSSSESVQQSIIKYCSTLFPSQKQSEIAAYRMIEVFLKYLQQFDVDSGIEFSEQVNQFSWIQPFRLLTLELLTYRYNHFEGTDTLPDELIYRKDELQEYTSTLWWLKKNGLLKNVRMSADDSQSGPDDSIRTMETSPKKPRVEHINKDELDAILAKGNACLAKAERHIQKCKAITNSRNAVTHDLDQRLYVHEQQNRIITRNLKMYVRE